MRDIHTFIYFNKKFKCGDLLVKDIYLFQKNMEETYKRILLEFNKSIPKLNEDQKKKFLDILFNNKSKNKPKSIKKIKEQSDIFEKEFHIMVGFVAKAWGFDRDSIMNMPYYIFERYYNDIPIATGSKEYDINRSKSIDKSVIKEIFGNSNTLKSNQAINDR